MGEIYEKAETVVVWLGEETKKSSGTFKLIHRIY